MEELQLAQKQKGRKVNFRVTNSDVIITDKTLFNTTSVPISIDLIDPNPVEHRSVPSKYLVNGGIFAFFALGFAISALMKSEQSESGGLYFFATFLGVIAVVYFISAYRGMVDVYLFSNRHNGQNLFTVSKNSPSRAIVDDFIKNLSIHVNKIRYPSHIPLDQKIEIYMKHLTFLREEGVISFAAFDEAVESLKEKQKGASVIKLA